MACFGITTIQQSFCWLSVDLFNQRVRIPLAAVGARPFQNVYIGVRTRPRLRMFPLPTQPFELSQSRSSRFPLLVEPSAKKINNVSVFKLISKIGELCCEKFSSCFSMLIWYKCAHTRSHLQVFALCYSDATGFCSLLLVTACRMARIEEEAKMPWYTRATGYPNRTNQIWGRENARMS